MFEALRKAHSDKNVGRANLYFDVGISVYALLRESKRDVSVKLGVIKQTLISDRHPLNLRLHCSHKHSQPLRGELHHRVYGIITLQHKVI